MQKKQTRKAKKGKKIRKLYGSVVKKQNERKIKKEKNININKATRTKSGKTTKSKKKERNGYRKVIKDKSVKKAAKTNKSKIGYRQKMQAIKRNQEKRLKKQSGSKKQKVRKSNTSRGKKQAGTKETYTCEFYDFSRKASIALTQSQRAANTLKTIKKIQKRAEKNYTVTLSAIKEATNNATTCSGATIDTTSEENFKTLMSTCSTTNV